MSTIPDYGPEPPLSGTFVGTLDELVQFTGEQGVILGVARVPEEDDSPQVLRVQWGGGIDASTGLKVVADQLGEGVMVLRRGPSTYVIGKPDTRDMVGRVFHVSSEHAGDYLEAVKALASDSARVAAVGDTIVVRDTVAGMAIIEELYDGLQSARGQWLVEVKFVELSSTAARTLGVDWDLSGTVAVEAGWTDSRFSISDIVSARISAAAAADANREHVRVLTTVKLHCVEGEEAEFQVGDTVPVPLTRTVSDQGTVTQDFEDVDTGVLLAVAVRTEPDGRLRVSVSPEVSQVTGFVEDRPIRSRRRIDTAAVLEPGGTLLAGGFTQQKGRHRRDGLPDLLDVNGLTLDTTEDDDMRVFVMVRVIDPLQP